MGRLCRPRAGGRGMWSMLLYFSDLLVTHCMIISLHPRTRRKKAVGCCVHTPDMFMRFGGSGGMNQVGNVGQELWEAVNIGY